MQELPQTALLQIASAGGEGGFFGLSGWGLLAGMLFSVVGFFYFRAGKRKSDFSALGTGIALMVFPYFVTKTIYIIAVGAGILALYHLSDKYQ